MSHYNKPCASVKSSVTEIHEHDLQDELNRIKALGTMEDLAVAILKTAEVI